MRAGAALSGVHGLLLLDAGVEIAVFALHAFVHLAQHHVGFGAEALLVGAQAFSRVPAARKGVVGAGDRAHVALTMSR